MKKFLFAALMLASVSTFAQNIENLTQTQAERVTNEFAMNFAHTAVAAPETDGTWGVEVGLVGGATQSPHFKDVVNAAGGDGSDFEQLYHAGYMARAHFPLDIFAEFTLLPEREISDVEVKARSFGLGWNVGRFIGLPLDVAVGINGSSSTVSWTQTQTILGVPTLTNITNDSTTRVLWAGVSKKFSFITPYLKAGQASSESELKSSATNIFASGSSRDEFSSDGLYWALGLNVDFFFLRFGAEYSDLADVKRASAKISLAF